MCVRAKSDSEAKELEERFDAKTKEIIIPRKEIVGREFPKSPLITSAEPHKIQLFEWVLIMPDTPSEPSPDVRHFGLNARSENLEKRFAKMLDHRCLVLLNGYYEFQYLT